ncbi:MAG: prepilin-type N-terminal cleavage/methylation domain-containing protein [Actinomycetota bacterium]|nr:prepilin-type N-terminal cleavage/methylation domain-containing protein [Actinomycetota bacterium]
MKRATGFTLIEMMVVLGMTAVLLTLGAAAARHYWLLNSLDGGADEIVVQLREIQERTIAESHPLIYGAWFRAHSVGDDWGILRFNPRDTSTSTDDLCEQVGASRDLAGQVYVESVAFEDGPDATTLCASAAPPGAELTFFFARGNATAGELVLNQDAVGSSRTITVLGVTGRVDKS